MLIDYGRNMFKNKTLDIRFACLEHGGLDFLRPVPAERMVAEWYKGIEPSRKLTSKNGAPEKDFTIKKCIPVLDALTSGYFMVTNHDIYYELDEEGNPKFSLPEHLISHGII